MHTLLKKLLYLCKVFQDYTPELLQGFMTKMDRSWLVGINNTEVSPIEYKNGNNRLFYSYERI